MDCLIICIYIFCGWTLFQLSKISSAGILWVRSYVVFGCWMLFFNGWSWLEAWLVGIIGLLIYTWREYTKIVDLFLYFTKNVYVYCSIICSDSILKSTRREKMKIKWDVILSEDINLNGIQISEIIYLLRWNCEGLVAGSGGRSWRGMWGYARGGFHATTMGIGGGAAFPSATSSHYGVQQGIPFHLYAAAAAVRGGYVDNNFFYAE